MSPNYSTQFQSVRGLAQLTIILIMTQRERRRELHPPPEEAS